MMTRARMIEHGGWRIEDISAIVGRTYTPVSDDLALAKALENFPILAALGYKV